MPKMVGVVVVGDGSRFKTLMVPTEDRAERIKQTWKARSNKQGGGGNYDAPVVAAYSDGSVAGNNTAAKNWLKAQRPNVLKRMGVTTGIVASLKS